MKSILPYCLVVLLLITVACSHNHNKTKRESLPSEKESTEWREIPNKPRADARHVLTEKLLAFLETNGKPAPDGIYTAEVESGVPITGDVLHDFLQVDDLNDNCENCAYSLIGSLDISDNFDTYVYMCETEMHRGYKYKTIYLFTVSASCCKGQHLLSTNSDGFTRWIAVRLSKTEFGQIWESLDTIIVDENGDIVKEEPEINYKFNFGAEGTIHSYQKRIESTGLMQLLQQ